jgi:hypothetical protein
VDLTGKVQNVMRITQGGKWAYVKGKISLTPQERDINLPEAYLPENC